MTNNLLRETWAGLDQADLRLLLRERIGDPGQYDGNRDVLHLPLAREKCRISLTYKGAKIVAIEPGAAFDTVEWERICEEIEESILKGPQKVGRDISFSTFGVEGWWRGTRSGVQIVPTPDNAPRARELAVPFILEFPIQDAGIWSITNHRRMREHRRITRLLNLLLAGATKSLPERRDAAAEVKWVQEDYFANFGEAVAEELSPPIGQRLEELESERYYAEVCHSVPWSRPAVSCHTGTTWSNRTLPGFVRWLPNAIPMLLDQLIPVGNIARRMDED